MKAIRTLAVLSAAMLLASCSLIQKKGADGEQPVREAAKPASIVGNPFSTRGPKAPAKKDNATEATAAETPAAETTAVATAGAETAAATDAPVPTAEQQAAARKLLAEQAAPIPDPTAATATPQVNVVEGTPAPPRFSDGLRRGGIAPTEDPASTADGATPGANSAEQRGLRSPKFPKGLPMDINGKLTGQH